MADTDLSPDDVREGRQFMQQFLLALLPDADVTEGSVEYDHLVVGFSYLFAYLRKQVGTAQARQSLLTLVNLPPDQDTDEAADAILSNLYQARDQGKFARGQALVHLSARTDVLVRSTSRFFKTRSLYYLVDAAGDYLIPAGRLRPNVDSTGAVTDWVGTVPLVAARTGADYNLGAGRFVNFERFNAFVTFVENTVAFQGGVGVEATADFVNRASTAISLQALINARSNASLLARLFPVVEGVVTIGNGDPEMVRDVVTDVASGVTLHVGGHSDIVVRTPVRDVTRDLVVGALFPRPDGLAVVFRHDNTVDFTTGAGLTGGLPVVPGDVLVVYDVLPEAPFSYVVTAVTPQELTVQSRAPFSVPTDEAVGGPPAITYTIGNNFLLYDNKHSGVGLAQTSRSVSAPNTVTLPGDCLYRVKKVEIGVVPSGFEPFADATTGTLLFTDRVNAAPAVPVPGAPLQYQVVVLNPDESQSARAVSQVVVGWPGTSFDGATLEVTYETLSGFDGIDAYVEDAQNRPAAADTLTRAAHPVYLAMTIPYALNSTPTPFQVATSATLDEAAAVDALVQFVNAYKGTAVIDVSLLATEARAQSDTVAAIYPFSIDYDLLGPDGRVFHFSTTDRVTVFPDGTHGAILKNPTDFGLPATDYFAKLAALMKKIGLSDRNVRYLTSADEVSFVART